MGKQAHMTLHYFFLCIELTSCNMLLSAECHLPGDEFDR